MQRVPTCVGVSVPMIGKLVRWQAVGVEFRLPSLTSCTLQGVLPQLDIGFTLEFESTSHQLPPPP